MKFVIDMNLSPLWVEFLAQSGYEAVHWSTIGQAAAPDTTIMAFAGANGYVVFTHDLDFGALLARSHARQPSVLQIRTQDVLPVSIGAVVVRAIQASQEHLLTGALVTIDLERNRIRLLPL